jgi:hypothetical protein
MQEKFKKLIPKIPEIIGLGIGIGLIFMPAPLFILGILAPNYEININDLMFRWIAICIFLIFIYYWNKSDKK